MKVEIKSFLNLPIYVGNLYLARQKSLKAQETSRTVSTIRP